MSESVVYNTDCLEYMKTLPDKAFDLAIVDPPYGDALSDFKRSDKSRFGGRFDKYKECGHAERERERRPAAQGFTQKAVDGREDTTAGKQKMEHCNVLNGMLPHRRNTLSSCSVFQRIRSSGAETTSRFRRQGAF